MGSKSKCYYCKIQVSLVDGSSPFIESQELKSLLPHNSEKVIEIDRILQLSSQDFPEKQLVCFNCLETLYFPLGREIDQAKLNKKTLEEHLELFEKELEQHSPEGDEVISISELEKEVQALRNENQRLSEDLKEKESEYNKLKKEENDYWIEANRTEMDLLLFEEDHSEIARRHRIAEDELRYLGSINILNELFYISTSNQFGTISGLRLGRLDSEMVSWDEINAAWGHCVLLLSTLFRIKGYSSAQCILYPLGTFSKISQVHEIEKKFELYINDAIFSKAVGKYNIAQELFLEVVYELSLLLEAEFPKMTLPVRIDRNVFNVNNVKIKLDASNKETWTRALKYMLQDLKFLIYTCIREDNK